MASSSKRRTSYGSKFNIIVHEVSKINHAQSTGKPWFELFVQTEAEDDMQVLCYSVDKHNDLVEYSKSKTCLTVSLAPNRNQVP